MELTLHKDSEGGRVRSQILCVALETDEVQKAVDLVMDIAKLFNGGALN